MYTPGLRSRLRTFYRFINKTKTEIKVVLLFSKPIKINSKRKVIKKGTNFEMLISLNGGRRLS